MIVDAGKQPWEGKPTSKERAGEEKGREVKKKGEKDPRGFCEGERKLFSQEGRSSPRLCILTLKKNRN